MLSLIEWLWFFSLMILTGYHMVIFRRKPSFRLSAYDEWPGVSVIIAHKNHAAALQKNIAAIDNQQYPLFEIIIVDDHSESNEKNQLQNLAGQYSRVRILSAGQSGKKNALTLGVQTAAHELILCMDADCRPRSDQWIKKMVEAGRPGEMVLGVSPIGPSNGWLNRFARFENIYTAIQYISWTRNGRAYMGVGRNMLYPRSLFLRLDPYASHSLIPYGDDDLLVQRMADHTRIRICDDPLAHNLTEAPATWKSWWKQKHRHLSSGHYYRRGLWWQPGLFGIAMVFHWFLLIALVAGSFWWKWLPVFLIGLSIRWAVYSKWARKLYDKGTSFWYPVLEIMYAFYLGILGAFTVLKRKKKWN